MADLTPAELLKQAELSYHTLMLGKQPSVFVDQNGERVEYTKVSASLLYDYIVSLGGPSWTAGRPVNRPLQFTFGRRSFGGMPR